MQREEEVLKRKEGEGEIRCCRQVCPGGLLLGRGLQRDAFHHILLSFVAVGICLRCDKMFDKTEGLQKHNSMHLNGKGRVCNKCHNAFRDGYAMHNDGLPKSYSYLQRDSQKERW